MNMPPLVKRLRGASLIGAIFLLLLFGALAAYMLWFGSIQQRSTALDITGARALQAARSGIEWGAYKLMQEGACAASESLSLAGSSLSGFSVTVTCTKTVSTDEQGSPVRLYRLLATACHAGSCPSSSPGDTYAERVVEAWVSCATCP